MADEPGHFRLHHDGRTAYKWELTTDLGQTIATAVGFPDRSTAERSIQWVKDNALKCPVVDPPYTGPTIG